MSAHETPHRQPDQPAAPDAAGEDYRSVREELDSASATSQLAAMLTDENLLAGTDAGQDADGEKELPEHSYSVDWSVVGPAAVLVAAVVIWGLAAAESFSAAATAAFTWVLDSLGWAFVLFGTVFVIFVLCVAFSRFGSIKLGAQDEEPEFRTTSWVAMMFAAGMGIGLMFYGASEPLSFYRDGVPGHEPNEVGTAMATAMFHWTLHPWAIYAIVGLAIGYSTFRVGRRQLISSSFVPLIGEKAATGVLGKLIDILSIFATVFGTACSLGLGALQIRAGLVASGFVDNPSNTTILVVVLILTLAFVLSALSGVGKGIQYLSNTNMVLAALLAVFVFAFGPTITQLNLIPGAVGTYLSQFFEMAGRTAESADGNAAEWISGWTIFYWAWWISWSPFVGMFLARISRGRTVREFCLGVMIVPSALSTVWFAIFGGTAISMEQNGTSIVSDLGTEAQLFNLLHNLPLGTIMGVVAVVLLGTFFITSADSASTVMGSMSQRGKSDAAGWLSATWGVLAALVGLTLLLGGGDDALNAVQNVTIVAATPFLLIVVCLMVAILKDLRNDVIYLDHREHQRFQRQLAIERRKYREKAYLEAQKQRRRAMLHRKPSRER
ncbi:choline/carnitine/betaine transport [Corynebacterium uterequi]|uniref:Choline/carnitine/betaine transport n=2 Tax=Corynebacterium uterequi TaxID=1072256 RepID=A0A0G3HFK8_9CORY|nr:BCCT family transporter [Corynebacterium uterequi]AKK10713.1 choline/carnitine/betaine transport [Corynebacterium uterequi]